MNSLVGHVIVVTCLLTALHVPGCQGQGRLQLPLGRSSVWRAGVDTPKNYDDHMLECGGLWYKMKRDNQCGICGDPVDKPRDNENGGIFDTGVISGSYSPGKPAQFKVLMNSNHGGFMEFKMCPEQWVSQGCFDQHPIAMADGSGSRFYMPDADQGVVNVDVMMPQMACQRCVMQWTYTGSRAWGPDENGEECEGCGPQYELRNCADITVMPGSPQDMVPDPVQAYNKAEERGSSPDGTYFFDPTLKTSNSQPQSPFKPQPMGNNNGDPWANQRSPPINRSPPGNNPDPWVSQRAPTMNQSPSQKQSVPQSNPDPWNQPRTPMNQAPTMRQPAPQNNPDPWNQPRPSRNQSPKSRQPTRRQPSMNRGSQPMNPSPISQSPYAPPQENVDQDPWTNPRGPSDSQSPPIPYAPPQRKNNNADPWTNPRTPTKNQSPSRRQSMSQSSPQRQPMNQSPYAPPQSNSDPDPWTNPRTPTGNQSPTRRQSMSQSTPRRQQKINQSPYAPPQGNSNSNGSPDPWTNPRMNQSPPGRQSKSDPWANQGGPSMNQSPPDNPIPYAPPQNNNNNNGDPWTNSRMPSSNNNNNGDPWTNPRTNNNNNNKDPWTNPRTPTMSNNDNNNKRDPWTNPRTNNNNNNNQDPWTNPIMSSSNNNNNNKDDNDNSSPPYAPPMQDSMKNSRSQRGNVNQARAPPSADPWTNGGPDAPDPWLDGGAPGAPSNIARISVLEGLEVNVPPRMECVAIGTKAGREGMDDWCTENCNLEYCPQAICECSGLD